MLQEIHEINAFYGFHYLKRKTTSNQCNANPSSQIKLLSQNMA